MPKTIVVIPTYNEIGSIESVLDRIRATDESLHVLVVDDNSPDGTGALIDRLAQEDQRIHVLHRTEKNGLGQAYAAGFTWALDNDYDYLIEMDADGSHQPEELPRLLALLDAGCDVAIGTRWIPGGVIRNWPWYRKAISRTGTFYSRLMLGSKLHDLTSGYRGFRASALRAMDFSSVNSSGYGFQVELAWKFERSGAVMGEFPITFVEREEGVSKMSTGIVVEALVNVTVWGLKSRLGRGPERLAIPARVDAA